MTEHGEWWRLVTCIYSHLSLLHIFFNLYALWLYGSMELMLGSITYCRYTFILFVLTSILELLCDWALKHHGRPGWFRDEYGAGYSGIVFGWIAFGALRSPSSYPIFGVSIPSLLMPFVYLFLTQLILPNAGFKAHLAGILAGFSIAAGAFEWIDDYLFACAVGWTLIVFVATLKSTRTLELSWIRMADPAADGAPARDISMEQGRIVYHDDDSAAPAAAAEESI